MIMVYDLLKRRIKYVGDDGGTKEGGKKMDKVWINYCGMPVCFGLKEISIVTGLRYYRPEEPPIKKTPHKGYRVEDLMEDLKNKDIPKHYREKLCLVWFIHSVLLARDVRKVIEHDFLMTTLYGFPCAFMLGNVKPFLPSESISRIIRIRFLIQGSLRGWLQQRAAKKNINEADLFNPPDKEVHGSSVVTDYPSTTTGAIDGCYASLDRTYHS
ncbi:hypothetical protein P3L10_010565 [Capsicum annuum]